MKRYIKLFGGFALCAFLLTSTSFVMSADARSSGGGFRSSGFRSSGFRSTTTTRTVRPSTTTAPKATTSTSSMKSRTTAPRVTKRPSSSTPKVTSPTNKTVNGKTYSKTGNVVGSNYKPRFSGGYSPPPGSVVYYRQNSLLDWLPLYFILTHGHQREAVVVEKGNDGAPDKETVVKEEGTDPMYVINWIVTILFGLGLIALVYWLITRKSRKKKYEF